LTLNTPASSDNFLQQFNQKYTMQAAPYLLLLEGEGLSLILDTVAQVGKDKEAIKKTWDSITTSNPRHGLFGSYYFDENGDAIGLEFVLQQIQNGEIVAVE
jgi:hypothetical protein